MNRQSANYVESVGDNKHYDWQTPKHNFTCLIITLGIMIIIVCLYIMQNTVKPITLSLEASDSIPNLHSYEFLIEVGKGNLKKQPDNAYRMFYGEEQDYYGFAIYSHAVIDDRSNRSKNFFNTIICKDQNGKEVLRHCRSVQAITSCVRYNSSWSPFRKDSDSVYIGPQILEDGDIQRYETFTARYYHDGIMQKNTKDQCIEFSPYEGGPVSWSSLMNSIEKSINQQVWDFTRSYGGIKKIFPMEDLCGSEIHIEKLQFPRALETKLVISFDSPMYFDIISVKPDSVTDTQLIWSTEEKYKQINDIGLCVYARSLKNINIQETLNFLYATLIGIFISFFIEFAKRLYNYRRQKMYKSQKPLRRGETLFFGLMFWWLWDKCKLFLQRKQQP